MRKACPFRSLCAMPQTITPSNLSSCNTPESGWMRIIEPKFRRSAFFSQTCGQLLPRPKWKDSIRRSESYRQAPYFARGWTAVRTRDQIFRSTNCVRGSIWRFSHAQSDLWWNLSDWNQYFKKPARAGGSRHRTPVTWLHRHSSQLQRTWKRADHSCGCHWGLFPWL